MIFYVCKRIGRVKFRVLREKVKIEEADVEDGADQIIAFAVKQVVKAAAGVGKASKRALKGWRN